MNNRSSENLDPSRNTPQPSTMAEEMVQNATRHIPSGRQDSSAETARDKSDALNYSMNSAQTNAMDNQNAETDDINQRISQRAYEIYQQRGGHGDESISDWLQAEAEIRSRSTAENVGRPVIQEDIDERYSAASSPSKS